MDVIEIDIDSNKLKQLPFEEQILFIGLGHIYNEINALTKILYWATICPVKNEAETNGQTTLEILIMKILAGKLNESWIFLCSTFFSYAKSKDFVILLNKNQKDSLDKIKNYFSRNNNINSIRNNFGFHFSPQKCVSALNLLNSVNLKLYLEKSHFQNDLFYFSELLDAAALVDMLGYNIQKDNFDKIFVGLSEELISIARYFLILSDGLMSVIIEDFKEEMRSQEPIKIEFLELENFRNIFLPWFTEIDDK